jgi:hypothetical protein
LKELAEDIRKNGLQQAIVIWRDTNTCPFKDYLIDGHNRLDALAMLGWLGPKRDRLRREPHLAYEHALPLTITYPEDVPANSDKGILVRYDLEDADDVRECVVALNLHRRHLTAEQKGDVIAKLLKANPEQSNRSIAKQVKEDHHKVAKVRSELESTGEVSPVEKTIGADGKARKRPEKRKTDNPTLVTLRERAALQGLRIRKRGSEWITIDADGKSIGFAWLADHPGATMEHFEQALPPAPTGCDVDAKSPEASAEQRAHAAEQTRLQPSEDAKVAKARKAHCAAAAPERTAEPQASEAASANNRIWKSRVTKVELLRMLEPILALAFKDDESQDLVATIYDGDAALYAALESAKGIIDELQTVLLKTNDSSEADQDDDEPSPEEGGKGILLALATNATEKAAIARRNIAGARFSAEDRDEMVAANDRYVGKWDGVKRKIRVKEAKDLHQNEGRREADANHAEAAPLIHDDLSIPEFLRREKHAGKAAA